MSNYTLIHDISNWQGYLSKYWQLFKDKGCKAIIIKATEGLAYYNYWKETAPIVKEQGFLLGSYHYYRQHIQNAEGQWVTCNQKKQAENYYNWIVKCGVKPDLPPALDVEPGNNPYGISSDGVESCLNYIEQLFGRTPMIYSNPSTLKSIAKDSWKKYPLWLAHYVDEKNIIIPKPWDKWTIWQFSDKITYTPPNSTAKKPIDHNWFNGSVEDLYRFCELGEQEVEKYIKTKPDMPADFLRFRNRPLLYSGDTLAVGRNVKMKVVGGKVKTDIEYWEVELDGYRGFVSANKDYTEVI